MFCFGLRHQQGFISRPNPIHSSRCDSNSTHLCVLLFTDFLNKHQFCADSRGPKMKTTLIVHRDYYRHLKLNKSKLLVLPSAHSSLSVLRLRKGTVFIQVSGHSRFFSYSPHSILPTLLSKLYPTSPFFFPCFSLPSHVKPYQRLLGPL